MNKKQSEGRRLNETKTSLARRGIQIYFYYKTKKETAQNREKNKVEVKKKVSQPRFYSTFFFLGFETLLCFILCFANCEHATTIFF